MLTISCVVAYYSRLVEIQRSVARAQLNFLTFGTLRVAIPNLSPPMEHLKERRFHVCGRVPLLLVIGYAARKSSWSRISGERLSSMS